MSCYEILIYFLKMKGEKTMEERNEIMETNNNTGVTVNEETKSSGGGLIAGAVLLGAAACVGIGTLVCKGKGKIEQKRIENLRKKGYVIYHEDEVEDVVIVDEDEDTEGIIDEKVSEIKQRKKD